MDGTTSRFSQDIQKSMSKSQFADQINQVFRKKREEQVVGGEGIEKEIKTGTEFVGTAAMEFLGGEPGPATERMFMGQQPGDTRTLEQVVQQSKEFRQESEAYNPQAAIVTTSASQIAAGLRGLSMITNIGDQPGQRYFESAMRGLQEGTASQADDVVSNITAAATSGVTSLGQTAAMGPFAMGSFFLQGMGSGASGYEQAYIAGTMGEDKDFSRGMQYVSGVLSGGIEVGTEHFGNVLELGIGKTAMGKVLGGTAKYGPGPQIAIALTKMSLVEGFVEEGPATLANYAKGRYITGEVDPNKKDWSDAFGDALVDSAYGSVGGAAGGGVSIPYGMYQAKKERDELTRRLVESNTEYADKDFWARVAPNTVRAMAPMSQAEREAEIEEAKKTVFQARADVEVMRQQFIDGDAKRVKAQAELKKAQKKKDQAAIDAAQQSFDDASTQIDDAKNKLAVLGADLLAAETRFEAAVAYTASRAPQITKTFDDVLKDEQATAAKPQTDADAMVAKELEGLGYDVVFYNDQNDKRDAFYSPFTPNTVYIRPGMNNETAGYVMGLGYHELLHDIQLTDSKLWSALRSAFDEESVIKAGVGYFQDMANAEDRMAVAAARASLAGDKTTGIDAIMRRHGNTLLTAEGTASELQDGIATLFRTGQAPGLLGRILARSGLRGRQAMTALKVRSILLARAKERQKGQRSEFSAQVREAMASAAARKQLEAEYKQAQAKPAQAATTPQAASQATQAAQATQATQAQQPPSQAAPGAAAVPQAASATAATVSGMTPAQAAAARTPNFKATVDLAAERIRKKQPAWAKGVDLEDLVARNEDKALKKGLSPAERQIADKLQKEMKKQFGPEYRSMWSRSRAGEKQTLDARSRTKFKSSLESSIESMGADPSQSKAASPTMWLQRLRKLVNDGTVKQSEIEWSGVEDWLKAATSVFTPAEVLEFVKGQRVYIESDESPSRWSEWTMAGGRSHMDILLTVAPNVRNQRKIDITPFTKNHFHTANLVAHARATMHGDMMFVDEIQSDWAQLGLRLGFEDTQENPDGVLLGPFVKSTDLWLTMTLKQILMTAVDRNANQVAFIRGNQVSALYNLRNFVSRLSVSDSVDGNNQPIKEVTIEMANRSPLVLIVDSNRDVVDQVGGQSAQNLVGNSLIDVVGSAATDALMSAPSGAEFTGKNLEFGGMGAGLYDNILPIVLKKLLRKIGGSSSIVEHKSVEMTLNGSREIVPSATQQGINGPWIPKAGSKVISHIGYPTEDEALAVAKNRVLGKQLTVKITPELKKAIEGGLPLFARNRSNAEAAATSLGSRSRRYALRKPPVVSVPTMRVSHDADANDGYGSVSFDIDTVLPDHFPFIERLIADISPSATKPSNRKMTRKFLQLHHGKHPVLQKMYDLDLKYGGNWEDKQTPETIIAEGKLIQETQAQLARLFANGELAEATRVLGDSLSQFYNQLILASMLGNLDRAISDFDMVMDDDFREMRDQIVQAAGGSSIASGEKRPYLRDEFANNEAVNRHVNSVAEKIAFNHKYGASINSQKEALLDIKSYLTDAIDTVHQVSLIQDDRGPYSFSFSRVPSQDIVGLESDVAIAMTEKFDNATEMPILLRIIPVLDQLKQGKVRQWPGKKFLELMSKNNITQDQMIAVGIYDYINDNLENMVDIDVIRSLAVSPTLQTVEHTTSWNKYWAFPEPAEDDQRHILFIDSRSTFRESHFGQGVVYASSIQSYPDNPNWLGITHIQSQLSAALGEGNIPRAGVTTVYSIPSFSDENVRSAIESILTTREVGTVVLEDSEGNAVPINIQFPEFNSAVIAPRFPFLNKYDPTNATSPRTFAMSGASFFATPAPENSEGASEFNEMRSKEIATLVHRIRAIANIGVGRTVREFNITNSPGIKRYRKGNIEQSKGYIEIVLSKLIDIAVSEGKTGLVLASPESLQAIHKMPEKAAQMYYGEGGYIDSIIQNKFGIPFSHTVEIEDVQEPDPDAVPSFDEFINQFYEDGLNGVDSGVLWQTRQRGMGSPVRPFVTSLFEPTNPFSLTNTYLTRNSGSESSSPMMNLKNHMEGGQYGLTIAPLIGRKLLEMTSDVERASRRSALSGQKSQPSELLSGRFVMPSREPGSGVDTDPTDQALARIGEESTDWFNTDTMDYGRSEDDLAINFKNLTQAQFDKMASIVSEYGGSPELSNLEMSEDINDLTDPELETLLSTRAQKKAEENVSDDIPLETVRFRLKPTSENVATTDIVQRLVRKVSDEIKKDNPNFTLANASTTSEYGQLIYKLEYQKEVGQPTWTNIVFVNAPKGLIRQVVETNKDYIVGISDAVTTEIASEETQAQVDRRDLNNADDTVRVFSGVVAKMFNKSDLDSYNEFLTEIIQETENNDRIESAVDLLSINPGDPFHDEVAAAATESGQRAVRTSIVVARAVSAPRGIRGGEAVLEVAVRVQVPNPDQGPEAKPFLNETLLMDATEFRQFITDAVEPVIKAQDAIWSYKNDRENEMREQYDEFISTYEGGTRSVVDEKYLNKSHRVYKMSPEWIAAWKELKAKRENWTMSARRREALNETVGMVPQSLRNLQRARLLYDAARKSGNEQVIKAAKKELRSAIRELTAAKSMSREGFAYNMGRREGRLAGEVRGQRKGRKEGRDQEAEVAKAKRIQMRAAFRNKVAALTDRINREVERNDALRDKMARVRRLNALGKADLAERLEKKVLKAWFAGQAKGSVAGAAAMKNEMVALRKDAVAMISMLPPSMRGKYLDAVARMRTPSGVAAVSKRVVQDMAQAEAKETVADLLRLRKRVKKVGLREDTRNSILGAVANGLAMLTSGGKRLLPYTDVADLSNRVAAANMMLEQARNDYDLEREEYRDLRDDRKEEAALDAQAFTATLSTLPSRPDSRISTEAPEESSWSKWASRFRSSDWYTLAEMIEGTYGGVMGKMWNSIKAGRNSMIADRRRIDGLIEQAYRNAGYAGYDGYISRAVGIYGSSSADVVSRVVGGRARTMTVDQMLHLAALDEDTVRLLRDSNDPTQEAAAPIVFSTYPNENPIPVTVQEIRSIQAALTPQQAALIAELKRIISDEVGPRAMEIYFQLNGRQPNSIPGYLPRQRLGIEIQEVTDVNGTAAQAINSMLANAGFGEERVQSKSTLVIGGLGRIIDSHVDESLRLIHLSMPLRYAVNVMKARGVRSNIDRAIGGGSHAAMMKMVYNAVGLSGKPKGGFFQRLGAYLSGALILLNYKTWLRQGGGALRLASEMTSADHARGIASGLSMTPRQRTERAQRVEAINSYFYERHRRSQAGLFANILGDPRQGQEQFVAAMQSSARSLAMMGNDLAAGKWRQAAKAARESTGAVGKMIRSTDHVLRAIDRQIMLVAFDGYRSGLKKQNPTLSDDQLDVMAAALAEEAFRRTQNVSDPADDTVFAAEQKFDNGYNILLFPFSSDPLKGYNQVQRAIMSKDKKKIAKTVAGVGGNIVMASAVSPLVTGTALVVASMFDGEDDDEEVTRKYLMEQELKYALLGAVGDVAAMGVGYTGLVADAIGSSVLGNPQMADDTLEPLAIRFYGETTKAIAMGNVGEAAAKMSQMAGVPVTAPIQSIAKTVKGVAPDDARLLDYYRALNKENRLNQSQLQRMKILQARERLKKKQESEQ